MGTVEAHGAAGGTLARDADGGGRFGRTAALALACGGWAALVLLPYPTVRVVVPAAFALGAMAMSRWPVPGATVICLGQAAGLALGAPEDSPAGLVAGLLAMLLLGRSSRLPFGLVPVAMAWAIIVATDVSAVRQILGVALFGGVFGVGYVLRTTTERTRAAEEAVRELETVEVAARAREALEVERHRLTAQSARLLAVATKEMKALAKAAQSSLDEDSLARVRRRGEAAVEELRGLLSVLRDVGPASPDPAPNPPHAPRPPWHTDALTAVFLWAVDLLVWGLLGGQAVLALWDGLTIAAVTLRRRAPAVAALLAAGGLVVQGLSGEVFVLGPALGVAVALIIWTAVGSPTPARIAALIPLAAASAFATAPADDGSLEVALAIVLGTAALSTWWHRLESNHTRAGARSDAYERRVQLAVDSALEHERLAVARDLHDLASGAIAVMMLHTSVADLKRGADLPAARSALDCVVTAGDAALEQLDRLEHALVPFPDQGTDDGRLGVSGSANGGPLSSSTAVDLVASLEDLVVRARDAGLDCRLELAAEPHSEIAAAVVWRVVNEGLTNALKHAPGSRVDVTIAREGSELVVHVRDDGARLTDLAPGTRLGLRGLSEILTQHAGWLRHGSVEPPGSGFELEARLPDPVPLAGRAVTGSASRERATGMIDRERAEGRESVADGGLPGAVP